MEKIKKMKFPGVLAILVFICSLFWLMPLILIFLNSFKSYNDMISQFLSLPKSWSLDMYIETWTKFDFPQLILTTLLYTVVTVVCIGILAPMASYKLARTRSKLSTLCFILIIMPMMVPFQSYMISLTRLASVFKLIGTRHGYIIISIGLCMPLAVYMIHGFIKTVPIELEECARIDGANQLQTYFIIVLPLLKPILTTVVVLDALSVWNDVIVNQLIGSGKANVMNIQTSLFMAFSTQTSDWEHALPGIVMSMIPSLIFFITMQKHIVGGATAGAIKG